MPEVSPDPPAEAVPEATPAAVDCPPPAARSPEPADDPRAALLALAESLARTRSHRLLIEYLRLRRSLR